MGRATAFFWPRPRGRGQISFNFHLATRVMPQGWDLGVPLGVKKNFFPKFNQIWCVSYLHECHMQLHHFWGPHPLGPWGGAKMSNIIKSQLQSQFQRFLNQTLCIFSQMKDIQHIRRDFHSAAWVMPRGGTWGTVGVRVKKKIPKFNQIWCVSY